MEVGDLIRYREKIPTDPDIADGVWGDIGIVTMITMARFAGKKNEAAIEYLGSDGLWYMARVEDVEVINENR